MKFCLNQKFRDIQQVYMLQISDNPRANVQKICESEK